jgi:carbon storage regulator
MLVLSRREDERVLIGGQVQVTVLEVRGSYVKLGFEAPRDIPIRREELGEERPADRRLGVVGSGNGRSKAGGNGHARRRVSAQGANGDGNGHSPHTSDDRVIPLSRIAERLM